MQGLFSNGCFNNNTYTIAVCQPERAYVQYPDGFITPGTMKAVKPSTVQSRLSSSPIFSSWPMYLQTARASHCAAFSKWNGKERQSGVYRQEHLFSPFFGSKPRKPRVNTSQFGPRVGTRPWPVKDTTRIHVHTYSGVRTQSTEQRRCRMRDSTKSLKKTIDLAVDAYLCPSYLICRCIHSVTIH